ncbi:30S ribosomal protein S7 [Candidatus Sumerlaeota bacterium]|nr:30S ribosomal protein S7 [Candidatus Sumerlaeota bacterium]
MSRKSSATHRDILPDKQFGSQLAAKFINNIMSRGKRSVAENIFYGALKIIEAKGVGSQPYDVFAQAVENVKPMLEVKSRRVGGANYQVPIEVRPERREALAFRWILDAARHRGEKTMTVRLANELMDAFNKQGTAVKKREDTHRMAEANKAFAHYRW